MQNNNFNNLQKTNILEAIINIINHNNYLINQTNNSKNRINNIGESLENFIKDAFANCLNENNKLIKIKRYNEVFSYLGNQNNPPDIMIRNGDALEVKKIQNINSNLALNSSYPKDKIYSNSEMLTKDCINCENWIEKDLIYCIGTVNNNLLKFLWFIYGSIYSTNKETYQRIKQKIADGINEIPNIELSKTNELGRVNKVDPLGITNLRIRGMWQIQNPRKVFDYLDLNYLNKNNYKFELIATIPEEKYKTFPENSRIKIENKNNIFTFDKEVLNPNNPAEFIKVKIIVFKY